MQFNMKDPQQRMVSELLEQQGRHKAQFIASAVLSYIQCPNPQGYGSDPPAIDEATLERMLLTIMEKHPRFAASNAPLGTDETPEPAASAKAPWKAPMDDDALKAITDTLAAFQTG